jgi:hypothetical protein
VKPKVLTRWLGAGQDIKVEPHPADWAKYKRAAGPIRNAEMLKSLMTETLNSSPLVVAFHNDIKNSKGTKNMLTIALKAKVSCMLVTETSSKFFDGVGVFVEGINIDKLFTENPPEINHY